MIDYIKKLFCKHKLFCIGSTEDIHIVGGTKIFECVCIKCGKNVVTTEPDFIGSIPVNDVIENLRLNNNEDIVELVSDGFHTFKELYSHRMILFAIMCKNNPNAWKSKFHHDDTMYENYFIVGINTEFGQITYHYHMENWGYFKCKEIDNAPIYDGYTSNDVFERLINECLK